MQSHVFGDTVYYTKMSKLKSHIGAGEYIIIAAANFRSTHRIELCRNLIAMFATDLCIYVQSKASLALSLASTAVTTTRCPSSASVAIMTSCASVGQYINSQ